MANILKGIISVEAPNVANVANQVSASVGKVEQSLKKMTPASGAATQSLINLSRVAQDAPYGFIGIANNLNPLLESFQRLRTESGSTGSAIRAFGSSLLGAGGLGLALGVVSSLLIVFTGHSKKAKEETGEHNKLVEEAKKKQQDFQNALDKASNSVLQQANNLRDLKDILISTSTEVSNLTDETVRNAIAQFLFNQKNDAAQKLINAELEKELRLRKQLKPFAGVREFTPELLDKDPLTKKIAEAKDDIRQINDLSFGLEDIFKRLFNKQFSVTPQKIKLQAKKSNIELDQQFDEIETSLPFKFDIKTGLLVAVEKELSAVEKFIQEGLSKIRPVPVSLPESEFIKAYRERLKKEQEEINNINNQFRQTAVEGLSAIAEGIGNALGGGRIADGFKAFGNVIATALQTLGKEFIKIGVLAVLAKDAIKKLFTNPAAAIAAGAALIVAGSALKAAIGKSFSGFRAGGGAVSGGGSYIVGERGPEVFVPAVPGRIVSNGQLATSGGLSGNVTFRIYGNELRGMMSKEIARQLRTMGR